MSVVTDWSVYLDEPKKAVKRVIKPHTPNQDRMSILGARQSGKTTTAVKILVELAKTTVGTHAFVTQTMNSRDDAMYKIMQELAGEVLTLTTKTKVTLENGSSILVTHSPNMIRGHRLSSAVIDCHDLVASETALMTIASAILGSGKVAITTGDMAFHEELVIRQGFSPHIL